jgi:hypothetical protein
MELASKLTNGAAMFDDISFSVSSFSQAAFSFKQFVEETIRIVFGGSGWNFEDQYNKFKITGKDRLGQDIEIEDEEIIEFLVTFSMWRYMQQ